MKTVLHISADFPDPMVPAKTKAVSNLLSVVSGFRHVVYSLNRVSWHNGVCALPFGEDRTAIAYGAPPYGIALARFLRPVADFIAADLARQNLRPDLIHAHKLSVEGLIAADLAERLDVPFIASVWGDTDTKIINAKRGLRERYREIAARAVKLLPAAPWTARYAMETLGVRAERTEVLPVITAEDIIIPPDMRESERLISVFALDSWQRKGLDVLCAAMHEVSTARPNVVLNIFGGGSPRAVFTARRVIERAKVGAHVRLRGALPHDRVQPVMNGYAAYVMAPRRETYGMVHAEAVLAGLPILWAKGQGIDGLIDARAGVRCQASSAAEVAEGIMHLLANQLGVKSAIAGLQAGGAFSHLQRHSIAHAYAAILTRVASGAEARDRPARARPRLVVAR
jgi:glycosyltransferase involved in cell wall biosynthesis